MLLACDLGSTFLKAVLCDAEGAVLRRQAVRLAYETAADGAVELPVERFEQAVADLLAGLRPPRPPRAIALTGQAQTFAVFAADGRPRTPFISWQDTRAAAAHRKLVADPRLTVASVQGSFTELHPQQMICQAARLAGSGLIGGGDRLVPLSCRLLAMLGAEELMDGNAAAMTGLYALRQEAWWPPALACCGLVAGQLPGLCRAAIPVARSGRGGERHGIPAGTPITLAGNDQSAAAYAAQVHRRPARLIGLGTAQVAYRWLDAVPEPVPGLARGPFPGGGGYLMAVDEIGGNAITWAAASLGCSAGELLRQAAAVPPGAGGLRFAAEAGSGAGRWSGGGADPGLGARGRAVLDHLAQRMEALLRRLGGEGELVIGDGADKEVWRSAIEQALGRPVRTVAAEPALGAAAMLRSDHARGAGDVSP